ncbi:MAG TPA: HAD hydrolase family protein [Candidatus Hydrogenedentes bacterium]|nr:MAG: putative phosphatase [Candidatus Hydrogenedentes bacterium ADurb.Bin170]HPX86165.1 HAD hydrolase family protein [Candidatus Hydrogenedentota bacterium]
MSVRLIVSDVDGCISSEESCAWDGELFHTFAERCRRASSGESTLAPLTLCTGRPQPYVEVLMKLLDICFPAICESGAVIYRLDSNLSSFASSITTEMIQGLHRVRDYITAEILPAVPGLLYQFGKEAQMSLFSEDPSCFAAVIPKIHAFADTVPGLRLKISPSQFYLNIDLEGVTKGSAIRTLAEEFGLRREEMAGIGDTLGDLSIRESVGFFACPSNAVPALKEVADYISPFPDLRGVLDILDHPKMQRH